MRKFLSLLFVLFIPFILTSCEGGNELRTVAFVDMTNAGSEEYAVKVLFSDDKRVDNKYYDIQIKADGRKTISIGREFESKKDIMLTNDWQSLTTLMLDEPNTEILTVGSDAETIVFVLNSREKVSIAWRAVVGGIEDNAFGTGKIITSPESCSDEFVLKVLRVKEN